MHKGWFFLLPAFCGPFLSLPAQAVDTRVEDSRQGSVYLRSAHTDNAVSDWSAEIARDQAAFRQILSKGPEASSIAHLMRPESWEALQEFYSGRDFRLAWYDSQSRLSASGRKFVARLLQAGIDGLDPSLYHFWPSVTDASSEYEISAAPLKDLRFSAALLAYAYDAQGGQINPARISNYIKMRPARPDARDILPRLLTATDPAAALDSFNPPHKGFWKLREELAQMRALSESGHKMGQVAPALSSGPSLRLGHKSPQVTLLRRWMGVPAKTAESGQIFDSELRRAIIKFQRERHLNPDGIVGPRTKEALNQLNPSYRRARLIANMERWRWLPRELGRSHILVNVPEFNAKIVSDHQALHQTRVIVGQRRHKTPLFSAKLSHVVINPYWNVPYSIASNELLPEMITDPARYFTEKSYEFVANGQVVDPAAINWRKINLNEMRLRQRPGRNNALGDIKFVFPNPYAIYMHDTPSKPLFKREQRAFSHGCVRVQDPFEFSDILLSHLGDWQHGKTASLLGARAKRVNLHQNIPVHIVYFTALANKDESLNLVPDLYGYDQKIIELLKL